MTLLQKIHEFFSRAFENTLVLWTELLDLFHLSSPLQSQTDIFNFRVLLYTVEVKATQRRNQSWSDIYENDLIPPATPVLYSAVTNPFWWYVHTQNTPNPTPKHPFSWPAFESGQIKLLSGQIGPCLCKKIGKVGKIFLEFFLYS